jgi:hypothetical protein
MVDAKGRDSSIPRARGNSASTAKLRVEETRSHTREDEKGREAVEVWHAHSSGDSRNLGIVPFNRESQRGAAEYPEVITIMRIFPDNLAGKDQTTSERLL